MRLILVRHAKAFERDPSTWPDDSQRPLTSAGRKEFSAVAKRLRRIQRSVDHVLASPAVRAWQTAEILHERGGWPAPARCDLLAPGEEGARAVASEEWTRLLAGYGEDAVVAWVGHEPTLGRIASWLLTAEPGRLHVRFRKGAVLAIDRDRGLSAMGWMVTPRLLRAL